MSNNNRKNGNTNSGKQDSLLVTKESVAAAGILFFFIVLLILCTRSFMFGELGLAVHSFLTGMFGYLAYPLVLGGLYVSVMTLLGKRFISNRRLFALVCFMLVSAALIVHTALTFNWTREGYIFQCFSSGETFPNTTAAGGLGGILVFGVSAVLSNVGAIIFFSALTAFFGYLIVVSLIRPTQKEEKQIVEDTIKQPPVKAVPQTVKPMVAMPAYEPETTNVIQQPSVNLFETPSMTPRRPTYESPTGAFSPFGTPSMIEKKEVTSPPKPSYGNGSSRDILFGASPADNYKTNLIFDPNSSANTRPSVDPAETMANYTPSYTRAYENAVNEQTECDRPVMVVKDNTRQADPTLETQEPALEKMSYFSDEKPKPLESASYPSYDQAPTPLTEAFKQEEEIDFGKIRDAAAEPKTEREYQRHDYMDMFSPSNPRLFEGMEESFARSREDDFLERNDRALSETRDTVNDREEFLDTRDTFRDREVEERGRSALDIFDEPEDDPYKLRSEFGERTERDIGREEDLHGSFGFGRDGTPASRDIPEPPKAVEAVKPPVQQKAEPPKQSKPRVIRPYKRVPLDDFDCRDIEPTQNEEEIEETKQNIIAILEEFKVTGATIASVSFGPTVTRYNVALPRSVSPQKIVSLDQSIAMALRSSGVNIYPNYEDGVVSIEIPNKERQFVKLGCMLAGNSYVNAPSSSLMFAIGKNVANAKVYGDISKMIHMLVAGSSGSGKSVFLGSLIISLIYKYSPEELRLILIDPKKTEFVLYNNLPHLMINEIITDANKTIQSLNWAIGEMNRRYGLFEQMSRAGTYVVNLDEYNAQLVKRNQKNERLPKIVIIIDELADLMLAAKKEIEDRIQNLTQKARAAGIHLIVATQRPSTDVITGVIKSNLSTRIAFGVATDVDSRVILDQSGAQKLLGKGDLLYTMPGINTPVRVQSAFISPEDSQKVVNYIKENNEAYYDEEATAYINNTRVGGDDSASGNKGEVDPMYIEALRHVILSGSASISMIQRKCSAGYNRAGRIIEWMEEMSYISAFDGAKARKVLITKEEFESLYGPLQ